MAKGLRSVFVLFTIFMVVTTFTAHVNCQMVECFDMCGDSGTLLRISDSAEMCCNDGGGGAYIVLAGIECLPCTTETFTVQLDGVARNIMEGSDGTLECSVSSDQTNNLISNIQLIAPNGSILAVSPSSSLTYTFTPFQSSDYGVYTCTANVTSPNFPGSTVMPTGNLILAPPPAAPTITSSIATPFAGDTLMLTCSVAGVDQDIQWLGPDEIPISSGSALEVGESTTSGGFTSSILTFPNLSTSQIGAYTCVTPGGRATGTIVANVPQAEVTITLPNTPPVEGTNYEPKCTGSVPESLEGTVEASWVAPDGTVISTNSSQDVVCLSLSFTPFQADDFGSYQCMIAVSSPYVTEQIINSGTLNIEQSEVTDIPAGTPTTVPDTTQSPPDTTQSPPDTTRTTMPVTPPISPTTMPVTPPISLATMPGEVTSETPTEDISTEATTLPPGEVTTETPTEDISTEATPSPPGEVTTETPTEDISTEATTSPPAINECELGTDNCNKMWLYSYGHYGQRGMSVNRMRIGICTDTEDGFICSCAPGFEGDGIKCRDINECELETNERKLCHQEARCFNKMGSFGCRCKPGNVGDGVNCCLSVNVINQLVASRNNQDNDPSGSRSSRRSRKSRKSRKSTSRRRGNRSLKSRRRRPQKSKSSHSGRSSSRSIGSNMSISDIDPACGYVLRRYGIDPAATIEDTFASRSTPRRSSKSKHGRKGKKG